MSKQKDIKGLKRSNFKPTLIKKRRKSDHCLNCGAKFDESYNFCPNCGQENDHNKASFSTLVGDFFQNYFSLDSKFSNSLLPFFFQPGYLTKKYIAGKRASFVHPVRLYLVLSLVFFFVFSMVSKNIVQQSIDDLDDTVKEIPDSTKTVLNDAMKGDFSKLEEDSLYRTTISDPTDDQVISYSIKKPDSANAFLTEENIETYMSLRENGAYDADDILDSLNTSGLSSFQRGLAKNLIRLDKAESGIVISQLLKNLPLMMIFLIPIFAAVLRLFYIRNDQYYITHLIHTVHLHSFAYVIYGLAFLIVFLWIPGSGGGFWTIFLSYMLVNVYTYFSFLNVYGQKWFKTLVKFLFAGFIYSWLLLLAIIAEMFLSVLTF